MFIGQAFENAVDYISVNAEGFLNAIEVTLNSLTLLIYNLMSHIPIVLFVLVIVLIPLLKKSYKLSIFLLISFIYIYSVGYWDETLQTLSIIFVGLIISLVIGIPLGILSAIYKKFDNIMKPILDFMQTMPSFVYLLPAVTFFGTGNVAAIVAIVIYAIAPVIRLTTLGIKEVPKELLEASDAFGSTKSQKLFGVQIPIAKSTIMTGVNQTIMMSLSMVVIAAMIGAEGLGTIVFTSVANLDLATAFESGLAIVFLAISLDRLTQLFNKPSVDMKTIYKKLFYILLIVTLLFSVFSNIYEKYNQSDVEVINVATNNGWADHVALNAMFTYIIEEETDYELSSESLDTSYIFSSLANGDNDVYFSAWMPTSQVAYDKYEDDIEYISTPFDDALIGIAVPSYMTNINSIADLKGNEELFDNVYYGIEPGSQTASIAENIISDYDLDMKQTTSSSAAMLQELDNGLKNEEPVAVTLWTPHWAFATYDIKMLDDPLESMGSGDVLNVYSRTDFSKDYPEVSEIIKKVYINNDQLSELMLMLNDATEEEYPQIVEEFLKENPDIYNFD